MSRGRRRDHDQASHRERPDERRANSSAGRRQVEAVQVQSQELGCDTVVANSVRLRSTCFVPQSKLSGSQHFFMAT